MDSINLRNKVVLPECYLIQNELNTDRLVHSISRAFVDYPASNY